MLATLTWKEARELLPLIALVLAIQGLSALLTGHPLRFLPFSGSNDGIPFVDESTVSSIAMIGGLGACAGLVANSLGIGRGTFQFLLHRPIERAALFNVKLAVGFAAALLFAGLPILLHAAWAATPGTHASPFLWAMTTNAWLLCARLPLLYLGAFLSGLRPGRWLGSRVLPLAAAFGIVVFLSTLDRWPLVSLAVTLVLEAAFLLIILRVAATRDYS